jgi:hypothetical protein
MRRLVARVGMGYVPRGGEAEVRREVGEAVDDLPEAAIAGLLEAGAIGPAPAATGAGEASSKEE